MKRKFKLVACGILTITALTGCQSIDRMKKDYESEIHGLNRTIEVYNMDGKLIKKIEGKMDIERDGRNIMWVDAETKKKGNIYYGNNTTVIIKEK